MVLIFRIAAGIIIGLLAVQAIHTTLNKDKWKQEERLAAEKSYEIFELQGKYGIYKRKYYNLKSAILKYYKSNGKVPRYISDLDCFVREIDFPVGECADRLRHHPRTPRPRQPVHRAGDDAPDGPAGDQGGRHGRDLHDAGGG